MVPSLVTTRRDFLKSATVGAAGTLFLGSADTVLGQTTALTPGPGNKWPGRVVVNFNKNAVSYNAQGTPSAVGSVIKSMVDESILLLTGESTVGAAWKAIFPPTLTVDSKITIKVAIGCSKILIGPNWESVKAIIDGLLAMDFGGARLPKQNISVYNRRCPNKFAAYSYTPTNLGLDQQNIIDDAPLGSGYTDGAKSELYPNGLQYPVCLKNADFLINVFRIGSHNQAAEYVTLGFKNHYGTYTWSAGEHTVGTASQHLRDINCTGVVYNKSVLSLCCGIFGADENSGGPGGEESDYFNYAQKMDASITRPAGNTKLPPTTIIMSTDPVAAEMQTIKVMRMNKNAPYGVSNMPKYLQGAAGISGAVGGTLRNIGIIDETKMDVRKIINGNPTASKSEIVEGDGKRVYASITASHLKGHNSTFIEFIVPQAYIGKNSSIEIFDSRGSLVQKLSQQILGVANQISWDEKGFDGKPVPDGSYIVKVTAEAISTARRFVIAR